MLARDIEMFIEHCGLKGLSTKTINSYEQTLKNAAKYSQHLYGKAADIQVQGISVEQVYAYADKLLAGRGGVGIYPPGLGRANGWVHVDVRKEKSRWRG